MKRTTRYKSEKWLNNPDSPSTGSIVCYDGDIEYDSGESACRFVEISDCNTKVRLHQCHTDTSIDFLHKIELLISELDGFRKHLSK